jgi:hypothetical protein
VLTLVAEGLTNEAIIVALLVLRPADSWRDQSPEKPFSQNLTCLTNGKQIEPSSKEVDGNKVILPV